MRKHCTLPNASCLFGIVAINGGFDINISLICSTLAFGRRFDAPSASHSLESAMILGVFFSSRWDHGIEMVACHLKKGRKLRGKSVSVSCSKGRGEL